MHAEFKLWPWRTLALGIPLAALATALVLSKMKVELGQIVVLFFTILAAGKALILASAAGNLGRAVLAIPLGAAAAKLSVMGLSNEAAVVTALIIVHLCVIGAMLENLWQMHRRGGSRLGFLLLGIALCTWWLWLPGFFSAFKSPWQFCGLCFAAIDLFVVAILPARLESREVVLPRLEGVFATGHGMLGWFVVNVLALIAVIMLGDFVKFGGETILLVWLGAGGMAENYCFLERQFRGVARVKRADESKVPGPLPINGGG